MGAGRRVAVLFNAPVLPPDHPDSASEADVVAVARAVADELARAGHDVGLVPAAPPIGDVLARLTDFQAGSGHLVGSAPRTVSSTWTVQTTRMIARPDAHGSIDIEETVRGADPTLATRPVVFNLIEGFGGASIGEAYITGLLELLGLPYTGCPPGAQDLCHSKARTKALLRGFGLPTAPFAVVELGGPISDWSLWPALVKPEAEDASLGIDQRSVVGSDRELLDAVARLRARHDGPALIEAYLPGREFNVGVLALPEPEALPIAEILYRMPDGQWPILTYEAKWATGSAADLASLPHCPAEIGPELADRLAKLAVDAFRATGCRDYARVDFRLDSDGNPMILEVNPNPDIGPTAGWARALRASGRDYGATLAAMVEQAARRGSRHGRP